MSGDEPASEPRDHAGGEAAATPTPSTTSSATPGARPLPHTEPPSKEPSAGDEIDHRIAILLLVGVLLTGGSLILYEWSDTLVIFGLTVIGVGFLGAALGLALSGRRRR